MRCPRVAICKAAGADLRVAIPDSDTPRPTLLPSPLSSIYSSRPLLLPLTSQASANALEPCVDHVRCEALSRHTVLRPFASRFRALGALFFSALRIILVFALLCLTVVSSFIFQYVVLLAVWRLDSFSRPLSNLVAALNADPNGPAAADARVRAAWRLYSRGILKDLEVASAVCGSILT